MKDSTVKKKRNELIGRLALAIRASQNVSDAYDEHVAHALGINLTDLRCLDILGQRGPLTAGQLAEAMHLSSGAITTLVDRLERAGYARRVRDTVDRRRVLIELDPEAERRAEVFYKPMMQWTVKMLEAYTDEQIELLVDFMQRGRELGQGEPEKRDHPRLQ